jgi:DNA polymerase elongation subunit (family B)
MTRTEKINKIEELKNKANTLKKEVDYYNALQLALKLVLNGSYGAFANQHFILFNNQVAGTITAQGRDLTKTMSKKTQDYWWNQWHLDTDLHNMLYIKNVKPLTPIDPEKPGDLEVSIYADTDSVFVGFGPAIKRCDWKNQVINDEFLSTIDKPFAILLRNEIDIEIDNPSFIGYIAEYDNFGIGGLKNIKNVIADNNIETLVIDGYFVGSKDLKDVTTKIIPNFFRELDFVHAVDKFRIAQFFRDSLEEYAGSFGVDNKEDFELERVSESIINIAKKKYIQHVSWEDGIPHERFKYLYPKGVELVRSSTPAFAREKIVDIVKYLFTNPESFNIKELLKLVKGLRKEFELADIDEIAMQSSCSNYNEKVLDDKEKLEFVSGAHFAVKAAALYNHLLYKNQKYQDKYTFIKSGTKIKYYYCKGDNNVFAYIRGSHPVEYAPEIDYDTQFFKCILSPINSIIDPLGMPEITSRLTVIMDIFGGL